MSAAAGQRTWTIGEAALLLRCPEWRLRRWFKSGRLPEPRRHGGYRVLTPADLDRARKLLEDAGR